MHVQSALASFRSAPPATWVNRLSLLVIVVGGAAIVWVIPVVPIAEAASRSAAEAGPAKYGVYFVVYLALALASLPVWPMSFLAGAVFGLWKGALAASIGGLASASSAFYLARWLGRSRLRDRLNQSPRLEALDQAMDKGGWKVIAAVRLAHCFPYGLQNYAFGLTRVPFHVFLTTTCAVTLPILIAQVWLGHLGFRSIDDWQDRASVDWLVRFVQITGVLAIIAALGYLGYRVKRHLSSAIPARLEGRLTQRKPPSPATVAALTVSALAIGATAAWCVAHRDAVREFVENQLQHVSPASLTGDRR